VLFADLKGSMELLADRDPEEARQLLDAVLERMMQAVHRFEGTVNQVMGDGIMALFGAPIAHEDHAVRASYAALAMQKKASGLPRASITLNRVPRRQVEIMVQRVTGGKALPAAVVQQVVAKTDGVPLFVEELTKMLLESGLLQEEDERYALTGALPPLAIPTTLHDSLMARLDRLTDAKEVAQLGATLGRTFAYELLRAVSPLDEGLLAQAAGHAGQVAEGLRWLAEALTAIEESGRGELLAEAYRLQGKLLLRQVGPDAAQAETCFQQALAIARRRQAKSLELRAAMSLSRLWQQRGKNDEACELLTPIYSWFTEGFDTADLQEAQALLEELS
jgi:tetratricopeptide (TPR) repeat protein